jgi:hypothetical protein
MTPIYGLLAGMVAATTLVIIGGTQSQALIGFVRRRFPTFDYDGQGCLINGLSLLAAFSLGLIVMYSLLTWH